MRVTGSNTITCDGCVGGVASVAADALSFRRWSTLSSATGDEVHLCPLCAEFPQEWVLEEVHVQCAGCGRTPASDPASRFEPWERAVDPERGMQEVDVCPGCFELLAAERPALDLPLAA